LKVIRNTGRVDDFLPEITEPKTPMDKAWFREITRIEIDYDILSVKKSRPCLDVNTERSN